MIPQIDYSKAPRPTQRPLTIAIDWDQTWTADPDLWSRFAEMAQASGHTVYIVTSRPSGNTSECVASGVKVIATAWQAKRPFCEELGIRVDIWIDDCPEFI